MRASELSLSLWVRLRRPATWGAVLGFGLLWALTRWGFGTPPARWQEFLYPFALPFAYLVLSPVPWQWTGDDRPLAGLFRGFLQALPWNVVWVVGLALALGFNHGGERRSSAHAQRAPRIEIMGLSPRLVVVS
ncbi:MAG: hypothetical protein LWX11_05965, partial [Firmicutes bacterium]|nr:hypothetical protein [Bacillota bacterium]